MNPQLMNPKLTDDAVTKLPLHVGRAELLEEIMSTPVIDDRPVRSAPPRRRTAWLVPAAAAAVIALVATTAWLVTGHGPGALPANTGVAGKPAPGVYRAVLDAPGWTLDAAHADTDTGSLNYSKAGWLLEIHWYPADEYQGFVRDRRNINRPASDGEPVQVLGRGGQLWAYSADDHTMIREVQDGHWFEVRGEGMRRPAYLRLLRQLRLVDQAGLEAALPESYVDGGETTAAVQEILDGIGEHVDPLIPPGSQRTGFSSDQNDPLHLGIEIAGAVACEWLVEFEAAKEAGDQQRMDGAAAVLATSRDWPVLHEVDADTYYPEVLWHYADEVAAGEVPQGYVGGLGCEG